MTRPAICTAKGERWTIVRAALSMLALHLISNVAAGAIADESGVSVEWAREAFEVRSAPAETPFTQHEGYQFGLTRSNTFNARDFFPPFFNGGGLASGDIDRDGWPDIVSATGSLITVYINIEGKRFEPVPIELENMEASGVFVVALVDLNNDGWLDLFASTYLNGNVYLLNQQGRFSTADVKSGPRGISVLSASATFGDIDRDGDLDAAIGNWFHGMSKQHPPPHSQNELWINDGGNFRSEPLPGLVGETLSTLLSDWSGDGWLDLVVGNDFAAPDIYYLSDGAGDLNPLSKSDGVIPHSTNTTMSVDTGDFDNDLDLDIFLDQITARATGPSAGVKALPLRDYCTVLEENAMRYPCEANIFTRLGFFYGANHRPTNVQYCSRLRDSARRQACIGMQVMMTAQRLNDSELCESIPEGEVRTRLLCQNYFEETVPHDPDVLEQSIPQRMNENVMLTWDAEQQTFVDKTQELGVGFTGWSWNAHFADVDNDQWQDLFVVAGSWFRATPSGTTANFFFHSEGGETFTDQTDDWGFQNYMIVSAYTVVDFDRDGDLDFITNSINGPLWLLRNNTQDNESIVFVIQDLVGNRDGIGSLLTIHYGPEGTLHQMREIKSGGGYLSFDEPQAHFGLGKSTAVTRVEIRWSTGERTTLEGPFDSGHRYTIKRRRSTG